MLFSRTIMVPLLTALALALGGCEIVADFDRDRIDEANVMPPNAIPMFPVPPERPPTQNDAGVMDPGPDGGLLMDAGPDDPPLSDGGGLPDAAGLDAGDAALNDAAADDAGDASGDASEDASL